MEEENRSSVLEGKDSFAARYDAEKKAHEVLDIYFYVQDVSRKIPIIFQAIKPETVFAHATFFFLQTKKKK